MKRINKLIGFALSFGMMLSLTAFTACKDAHEHVYGDWQHDETGHWQECTEDGCTEEKGHKFNEAAHTGDKCDVCDYEKTTAPAHEHTYSEWKYDENGHWKTCVGENCDAEEGKRFFEGEHEGDPCECGYTETVTPPAHEHAYGDWQYDANSHWQECIAEDCDEEEGKRFNEGAHENDPCDVCGYDETVTPPEGHKHTYSEWKYDENTHWMECTAEDCDAENTKFFELAHTYKQGTDNCDVCGYDKTTAPAHEHTYSEWKHDENGHWKECVGEDCDEVEGKRFFEGEHEGNPCECGYETEVENPPVEHEHTYSDWQYDANSHWKECTAEDCDEDAGKRFFEGEHVNDPCDTCGYDETVTPPEGHKHTYSDWQHDENGHWKECTAEDCDAAENARFFEGAHEGNPCECGYETEVENPPVEKHEHVYGDWQYDKDGHWKECTAEDCDAAENARFFEGEHEGNPCECGYETEVENPPVEKHEHVYGDWQYDKDGHWKECTAEDCDAEEGTRFLAGEHVNNPCDRCGYKAEVENPPVEEHEHKLSSDWVQGTTTHWKECTAEGCPTPDARFSEHEHYMIGKICTYCGYEEGVFTSEYIGTWKGVGTGSEDEGVEYTIVITKATLKVNGVTVSAKFYEGEYIFTYHGRYAGTLIIDENGNLIFSASPFLSTSAAFYAECTREAN